MNPSRLLPLALVVAALLAIPSTAGAATSHCSGSVAQGFWTHITATDVGCTSAKSLIRRWIRQVDFGNVDPPPSARVGGWTCRIRFSGSQGEAGKLTCTASRGRKVTTIGSP